LPGFFGTLPAKETLMIELTEQQRQDIGNESPPRVIDPFTKERFVLIREDIYEKVKKVLSPMNRNWDNPEDDDLIQR
jgi:hypothetical protein